MIGQQHDMLALALACAGGSGGGGGGAVALSALRDIAPDYSSSSRYSKGDYRIYDRNLYRAKQDINTPEAWTAAHWDAVTVGESLEELDERVTALENSIPDEILAAFPQETITDAPIASFSDGADGLPVKDLVIDITPVQAGTGDPSPDNVRPISGWTGANVVRASGNLFGEWITGKSLNENGKIYSLSSYKVSNFIDVRGYSKVRISVYAPASGWRYRIGAYDKNKAFVRLLHDDTHSSAYTYVYTYNVTDFDFVVLSAKLSVTNQTVYGDYMAIPISWQTEAGTVYGGTLDVLSGLLTVTHANIASYAGETINEPWISSMDVYAQGVTPSTGAQVVYPLTTPQTYQLAPTEVQTLLGANSLWADTGNVDLLTYRADPTLYVDKRLNTTKGIIAGVEATMTATKNYTTGDLLVVGDSLYKVTVNIANGGSIIPGTNVTATTVAEQLLALANA